MVLGNLINNGYDCFFGKDEMLLSSLIIGCKGFVGSTFNFMGKYFR